MGGQRKPLATLKSKFLGKRWYLVVLLIEEVSLGIGTRILTATWEWLRGLADRPLREGGVVVVIVLAISILWAAVDPVRLWREQRNRSQGSVRVPLPPEERVAIQDLRTLWLLQGLNAVGTLHQLFDSARVSMDRRGTFLDLMLKEEVERLRLAFVDFTNAVAEGDPVRLSEVHRRFNEMYAAYVRANKGVSHGVKLGWFNLTTPPLLGDVARWRAFQRAFRLELGRINTFPAHATKLEYVVEYMGDDTTLEWMRAAEVPAATDSTILPPEKVDKEYLEAKAAHRAALAAHDLYEENQRLQAELDDAVALLRTQNQQLQADRDTAIALYAEAKRDTERLDWLECGDSITGHVTRLAAAENYWAGPKGTTFRAAIDGSMKGDRPSEQAQ